MSKSTATKALLAAAAAMAMIGAAAGAQAQPYGYNGFGASAYSYDACKRAQTERGTAGALVGGGMGAVIGSNAAARNARTEGALLGGLLGAVIGGTVGNKSAACTTGAYVPAAEATPPPPPAPPPSAYNDRYDRDGGWDRDAHGERFRLDERRGADADGCTLAESPIYMPDGRVQTRFVRVCRDASGRYAVVD